MSEIEEVTEGFRKLKIPKPAKPKPPKKIKIKKVKSSKKSSKKSKGKSKILFRYNFNGKFDILRRVKEMAMIPIPDTDH